MFSDSAPLLFRPQFDLKQWLWGLRFLSQCNDAAFECNVQQLVALGAYSQCALKDVVRATGKGLAELLSGHKLDMAFKFYGA